MSLTPSSEGGSKKVSIWPEWTDAELATEKWDLGGGGTGKGRDKGKSVHTTVVGMNESSAILTWLDAAKTSLRALNITRWKLWLVPH